LLQHRLRCLLLLVWRVAVLAQTALDEHAELGPHILTQGPVDGDVAADGLDGLLGNGAQRLVAQHLDGAVVGFQRVVERQLVLRESELLAAGVRLAHVLGELDQLLDHLRCLDSAILVAADRLLEHLGERACLHHVFAPSGCQFSLEQLLQELYGEVALGHPAHLGEEFVGENRDVRLRETGGGEDVDDTLRRDRPRDDLPDPDVRRRSVVVSRNAGRLGVKDKVHGAFVSHRPVSAMRAARRLAHRSSGRNPVRFAIRANIRGPISSSS